MNKSVAIVGSHSATREFAPYDDPSVDIWVFNEAASTAPWIVRMSGVFQMHAPEVWQSPVNINDENHRDWLRQDHPFPILTLDEYPEIPSSVRYPIEKLCDELLPRFTRGGEMVRYFTSSPAYAIALAIYQRYERIEIYGIEMETQTEYDSQREGVYFWIGVAVGAGIRVTLHPASRIFRAPLYGYDADRELSAQEIADRLDMLIDLAPGVKQSVDQAGDAQLEALNQAVTGDSRHAAGYFETIKAQGQAVINSGILDGALYENRRYLDKIDAMVQTSGAYQISRQEFERVAGVCQEQVVKAEAQMHASAGEATATWRTMMADIAGAPRETQERNATQYAKAHQRYIGACYDYGRWNGIMQENLLYLDRISNNILSLTGEIRVERGN